MASRLLSSFASTFNIICSFVRYGRLLKFGCSFDCVSVLSNFDLSSRYRMHSTGRSALRFRPLWGSGCKTRLSLLPSCLFGWYMSLVYYGPSGVLPLALQSHRLPTTDCTITLHTQDDLPRI